MKKEVEEVEEKEKKNIRKFTVLTQDMMILPWMCKGLLASVALFWVHLHKMPNKIFC